MGIVAYIVPVNPEYVSVYFLKTVFESRKFKTDIMLHNTQPIFQLLPLFQ